MKSSTKKLVLVVLALGAMLAMSTGAMAQLSSTQTIALNATLTESLTLGLDVNAVNFTLTPGSATNAGSTGVLATTDWILRGGRTLTVRALFTTPATALTDGTGNNIPGSAFGVKVGAGALVYLGATYTMENIPITVANTTGSVNDAMTFNINLSTGALPNLPAGTYTGTLNIQADAV